jgi:hypothetical protein
MKKIINLKTILSSSHVHFPAVPVGLVMTLFTTSLFLSVSGLDHGVVKFIYFSTYVLSFFGSMQALNLKHFTAFMFTMCCVPVFEFLDLSNFSLSFREVLSMKYENEFFIYLGSFSLAFFALIVPVLVVHYRIFKLIEKS